MDLSCCHDSHLRLLADPHRQPPLRERHGTHADLARGQDARLCRLARRRLSTARPSRTGCATAGIGRRGAAGRRDRKSTRLNSSYSQISYAVFCLKKKKKKEIKICTYEKQIKDIRRDYV